MSDEEIQEIARSSFFDKPAFDARLICDRRTHADDKLVDVASDEYLHLQMRRFGYLKELRFLRAILLGVYSVVDELTDAAAVAKCETQAYRDIIGIVRCVLLQPNAQEPANMAAVLIWLLQHSVNTRSKWMSLLKPKRTRTARANHLVWSIVNCCPADRVTPLANKTIDQMMCILVCEHVRVSLE